MVGFFIFPANYLVGAKPKSSQQIAWPVRVNQIQLQPRYSQLCHQTRTRNPKMSLSHPSWNILCTILIVSAVSICKQCLQTASVPRPLTGIHPRTPLGDGGDFCAQCPQSIPPMKIPGTAIGYNTITQTTIRTNIHKAKPHENNLRLCAFYAIQTRNGSVVISSFPTCVHPLTYKTRYSQDVYEYTKFLGHGFQKLQYKQEDPQTDRCDLKTLPSTFVGCNHLISFTAANTSHALQCQVSEIICWSH